jgi:predicted amidohydrolase
VETSRRSIAVVVQKDRAHRAAIQHRLKRLAQTVDLHAQILSAGAVDLDKHLWLGGVIAQPHLPKARVLFHPLDQPAGTSASRP